MRYRTLYRSFLQIFCAFLFSLIATLLLVTLPTVHAATRDPLQWPFASDSIWNMPIGSDARYVDATIGSRGFGTDIDWFVTTSASDPLVPTYMPGAWGQGRCSGTTPQQQAQWHPEAAQPLHVPTDLIIPDAITSGSIYSTPNSSSAFLEPDGKTLVNFTVTARCQAGAPLYGTWFGQSDLYGDGIRGGHGASAMSSIGGSIRTGELLGDQPIHHALKVDIWGNWLYYDTNGGGHRWPAVLADAGAPQQYKGSNPALVMGSLLALPPDATPGSLGITSSIGIKLFHALQDYGAYIVDDTGRDVNALCIEHNADVEFQNVMGHSLDQDQEVGSDFGKMMGAVKVVDNNNATSIGGGGTPRAPLAPAFGVPILPTTQPTVTPTPVPATPTPTLTTRAEGINITMGSSQAATTDGTRNSTIPTTTANGAIRQQQTIAGGIPWQLLGIPAALLLVGGVWFALVRTRRRGAPT